MPAMRTSTFRLFLPLLVLCLAAQYALAGSATYHQSVAVVQEGGLSLELTNDSHVPITAFVVREISSSGAEERTYFDVYVDKGQPELPLAPGASIHKGLTGSAGTGQTGLQAEIPAVIFKDGSSAGDPVWTNIILARRARLHDRLLKLRDLLNSLVGTGIAPEAIAEKLRTSLIEEVKRLPDDDLRSVDTITFFDATAFFDRERPAKSDYALKLYLSQLERRALVLEYSRPDLDKIRALPVSIPIRTGG